MFAPYFFLSFLIRVFRGIDIYIFFLGSPGCFIGPRFKSPKRLPYFKPEGNATVPPAEG